MLALWIKTLDSNIVIFIGIYEMCTSKKGSWNAAKFAIFLEYENPPTEIWQALKQFASLNLLFLKSDIYAFTFQSWKLIIRRIYKYYIHMYVICVPALLTYLLGR